MVQIVLNSAMSCSVLLQKKKVIETIPYSASHTVLGHPFNTYQACPNFCSGIGMLVLLMFFKFCVCVDEMLFHRVKKFH